MTAPWDMYKTKEGKLDFFHPILRSDKNISCTAGLMELCAGVQVPFWVCLSSRGKSCANLHQNPTLPMEDMGPDICDSSPSGGCGLPLHLAHSAEVHCIIVRCQLKAGSSWCACPDYYILKDQQLMLAVHRCKLCCLWSMARPSLLHFQALSANFSDCWQGHM